MRIILAGLAGAVAMFVWVSIAHISPLATVGFSQIPDEAPVMAAMHASIGAKAGLYFFPWVDPKDPKMMEKSAALMKANPSGLIIYQGPGAKIDMLPMLIEEFGKEFAEALIAALLLSLTMLGSYLGRVGFVTLVGVPAAIATNVSYYVWYGFPADYTLVAILIEVVGALAAGLAIAAIIRPRAA